MLKPKAKPGLGQNTNRFLSTASELTNFNALIGDLCEELRSATLPDFGSGMLCVDDNTIVQTTIAHRILSKFERPSLDHEKQLIRECYESWLDYESEHLTHHKWRDRFQYNAKTRGTLYRARMILHKWFEGFKLPSFQSCEIDFTPGESLVSKQGRVSLYQKLKDRRVWTVTHDASDDFIRLCYNNNMLKRCAKGHFKKMTRKEMRDLWWEHSDAPHVGYSIFRARMLSEVVTIVYGSRASTVPKNNAKRRFINVEPFGNVILQRIVASKFRQVLLQNNNDLELGQLWHKERIASPSVSTIDFSNASDSVLCELVEFLFPANVTKYLFRYRSEMVLIDGVYHLPKKLSSMGNGFTFETMTLMLLAIARTLDEEATVYGDDVIIANDVAWDFVRAAECAGFIVNEKKTFIQSRFRESCGAFYLDGYGYITCFDFHWCENTVDQVVTTNKLFLIFTWLRQFRKEEPALWRFGHKFARAYEKATSSVHPLLLGPVPTERRVFNDAWLQSQRAWEERLSLPLSQYDLSQYIFCERYRRKHMRHAGSSELRAQLVAKYHDILEGFQYRLSDLSLVCIPALKPRSATRMVKHIHHDVYRFAFYMYSGRRSEDVQRGRECETSTLSFVTPNGIRISLSSLNKMKRPQ